jgi:hypothetical protein
VGCMDLDVIAHVLIVRFLRVIFGKRRGVEKQPGGVLVIPP